MTFAAPIKVTIQLIIYDTARGRRAHRARHQGAGGLLRRDPADDRERYVHHQRHRARRRQPAAPQPGRVLRSRQGQDALVAASCSTRRASSRTAARGSTSSSTPRTSSTCASTAAGRCTRRCCSRRSATRTQELLNYLLRRPRPSTSRRARSTSKSIEFDLLPGQRATRDIKIGGEVDRRARTASSRAPAIRKLKEANLDRLPIEPTELDRQGQRRGRHRRGDRRGPPRVQRRGHRGQARAPARGGIEQFKVLFIDGLNVGSYLRDTLIADKVTDARKTRSWRSTGACARVIRRRSRRRRRCSTTCSSTPSATTCRAVGRLKLNYKFYRDDEDRSPRSRSRSSPSRTSSRRSGT